MPDGQVIFEITADGKHAIASIKDVTAAIDQESKKWDKSAKQSADGISGSFDSMLKKLTAGFTAAKVGQVLADWGKQAIAAASDLEEVQNVVDVTFGDGAAKIEKWSKAAGTQFGLTEKQAKQFTSTLGAMMKSAGLAGPEIVDMSTDLAGLAADMASFYNLDFETAFQKIRSGISGETEPLKQLGINMSVANLQAYALSKGITTAFDKMSQGEQTMLRYEYLMQATADAQGDFARTSDGYANSLRVLETNIETLKTTVGTALLPIVTGVVSGVNDMLSALTVTKPRTVLDEIADINLKTEKKLADIEATAENARLLSDTLASLSSTTIKNDSLTNFVQTLSGSINGLDGAMDKAKKGDYAGTISEIATAMGKQTGTDAEKWKTLLLAIGDNLPGAVDATLDDNGQTAAFLQAAGDAAASLGGEYPGLWDELLTTLGNDAGAVLTALANGKTAPSVLSRFASAATNLRSTSAANWENLLTSLTGIDGLENLFGENGTKAARNIRTMASGLAGNSLTQTKAEAWETLMTSLAENAEAVSSLTDMSVEDTKEWLSGLAESANELEPDAVDDWDKLFGTLLSGLGSGENSDKLLEGMTTSLLSMGTQSEKSIARLKALGYSTEEIEHLQRNWLQTCKDLVDTIPGLNEIINTETGEVKGGVSAIDEYVDAWERGQRKIALWKAHNAKVDALEQRRAAEYEKELAAITAKAKRDRLQGELDALKAVANFTPEEEAAIGTTAALEFGDENLSKASKLARELEAAEKEATKAAAEYEKEIEANAAAAQYLADEEAALNAEIGEQATIAEDAANATDNFTDAQKRAATEAVASAKEALQAVQQYYQQVRDQTDRTLGQMASGFNSVQTPVDQARAKMKDLTSQINELNREGKDVSGLQQQEDELNRSIPSVRNMTQALQSQLDFLKRYNEALAGARAAGASEDILAFLSDGSAESLDYLEALASGAGDLKELNEKYAEVQAQRKALSDTLTEQQLAADETFDGLVESAKEAVANLDMYDAAKDATTSTVSGLVDGLAEKETALQAEVDVIKGILAQLDGVGNFNSGLLGGGVVGRFLGLKLDGSLDKGLDYVPFDNYLAALHEGESILTAEEARIWRNFKYGGQAAANTIDYGALHGAIWDGAPKMGGNVYLDGRAVGRVISQQQADSYRDLERSGWQG